MRLYAPKKSGMLLFRFLNAVKKKKQYLLILQRFGISGLHSVQQRADEAVNQRRSIMKSRFAWTYHISIEYGLSCVLTRAGA